MVNLTSCIKSGFHAKRVKALHGQLSARLFLEMMKAQIFLEYILAPHAQVAVT
jgi:hypothetical protein